jgi:hypothetical protein
MEDRDDEGKKEVRDIMQWEKRKVLYRKKAGVRGVGAVVAIVLIVSCFSSFTVAGMVPHPIYGTATWEGGGNADGASVAVSSSLGT